MMMNTKMKDRLELINAEIAEFTKKATARKIEMFNEGVKLLFAELPLLESFSFRAYTDYFNDGDECTYSAHIDTESLDINGVNGWDVEDSQEALDKHNLLANEVSDFLYLIGKDVIYDMFGDHVQVTVDREQVSVDSYTNHD
jgi:hypothetical protein